MFARCKTCEYIGRYAHEKSTKCYFEGGFSACRQEGNYYPSRKKGESMKLTKEKVLERNKNETET